MRGTMTFAGLTTGVAEPATWTMMTVGSGGAGAILRRRRPIVYA